MQLGPRGSCDLERLATERESLGFASVASFGLPWEFAGPPAEDAQLTFFAFAEFFWREARQQAASALAASAVAA